MALGGGGMGCPEYACGVARKNGAAVNGAFAGMANSPRRTPAGPGLDTGQPDVTSLTCMRSCLILARACAVRIKPAHTPKLNAFSLQQITKKLPYRLIQRRLH